MVHARKRVQADWPAKNGGFMKIYKAYLLVAGFCLSLTAMAQEDDFGIWTSVGATKKITKDFGITGELEYRTRNDSKTTERWSGELSMNYKLAPYLKLEGGYVRRVVWLSIFNPLFLKIEFINCSA